MEMPQNELIVLEDEEDSEQARTALGKAEKNSQVRLDAACPSDEVDEQTNRNECIQSVSSPKFTPVPSRLKQQANPTPSIPPSEQKQTKQANLVFIEQNAYSFRRDELNPIKARDLTHQMEVISDFNSEIEKHEELVAQTDSEKGKSNSRVRRIKSRFKDINDESRSNKIIEKAENFQISKPLVPNILSQDEEDDYHKTEDHLKPNKNHTEIIESVTTGIRSRKRQKTLPPLAAQRPGQIYVNTSNIIADESSMVAFSKKQQDHRLNITNMSSLSQMVNEVDTLKKISEKIVPISKTFKCVLRREKQCFLNYCHPEFSFHLRNMKMILNARKQFGYINSHYNITAEQKQYSRQSESFLGCLVGNFTGTCFNLYQNRDGIEELVCTISYETELVCSSAFRKTEVFIKNEQFPASSLYGLGGSRASNLKELYELGENAKCSKIIKLVNKKPEWREQLGCYSMNLKGKCKMGSVKNTVLISQDEPQRYVLLFCKTDQHQFCTEISHPLSPFLAMGIILSSFDFKLLCQ